MARAIVAGLIGSLVGLGLGWGLFGGPLTPGGSSPGVERSDGGDAADEADLPRLGSPDDRPGRPRVAPRPPACPACPTCPSEAEVARCERTVASLRERLRRAADASADAAAKAEAARRGPGYDAPTAAGRRTQAAQNGTLLIEFPDWNDRLTLRDGVAAQTGLDAPHQQELEELYAATNARLRESLRQLYADLVGDPQAGGASTLNALLHDVMSLSPQEACRQKLPALLQALADEAPLPAPGPDPLPCEVAVRLIFTAVDEQDEQAREVGGDPAAKALWSGSSAFEYGPPRKP